MGDTLVQFEELSEGATTYAWDFGDGTQSSNPNPFHTYSAGGEYEVTLVASNECGVDTTSHKY